VLGNFPLMRRLRTLLLANNRVAAVSPALHLSTPALRTLVLTNNALAELGDLEPLAGLRALEFVVLLGNAVRDQKWYREWLAWRVPSLRVLDFQRVRDKVRPAPAPRLRARADLSRRAHRSGRRRARCSRPPRASRTRSRRRSPRRCRRRRHAAR
jgi:hypothetical protein